MKIRAQISLAAQTQPMPEPTVCRQYNFCAIAEQRTTVWRQVFLLFLQSFISPIGPIKHLRQHHEGQQHTNQNSADYHNFQRFLNFEPMAVERAAGWRQLACYAGVAPFPHQSGTSIHGRNKVHPLADKKLKSLLNMCAICAVRHDKELKTYYERKVAEGKAKMLVINNVRAKLLARVFAVINRGTPFVNMYKFVA